MLRVLARRRQEVFGDPIVSPRGHKDVLFVLGGVAVENGANKAIDSSEEAIFKLFFISSFGERGEVVPDYFTPGSLVTVRENSLNILECLGPIPLQLVASMDEVW